MNREESPSPRTLQVLTDEQLLHVVGGSPDPIQPEFPPPDFDAVGQGWKR